MTADGRSVRGGDRAVAVVPAAGTGVRVGASVPKQYLRIGGAPVLVWTLRVLARAPSISGSVVVVPADRIEATGALLRRFRIPGVLAVVAGGAARQESVWRGLQAAPDGARWIVVHDAVRPFITARLLQRVVAAARRTGAATCGLPIGETVKRVRDGGVETTLDREGLWLVQTPQAFRRELLREAHEKARRDGRTGTDDAVLVERLGGRVAVVAGLAQNLKITTRDDLARARLWMRRRGRWARS